MGEAAEKLPAPRIKGAAGPRLIDRRPRRLVPQGNCKETWFALKQDPIPIDEPLLSKRHVIIEHEPVHRVQQLEIANVREKVGLHDGEVHPTQEILRALLATQAKNAETRQVRYPKEARARMGAAKIIFVCGARRTGTTLLASVLSADERTPPFPGEAQMLPRWLETYRWAREAFAVRAQPFFSDEDELRVFYRSLLDKFVSHCSERFGHEKSLVLKSPELSLTFDEVRELFPDAAYVVTLRDPRDQVASEWRVLEKRRTAHDVEVLERRDFGALARAFIRYYTPIANALEANAEGILVQSFEQMVGDFGSAVARLTAFTGLDLSGFNPDRPWPRLADSYWAYGTSPSDTPHYGQPIEAARAGSHTESMSTDEAGQVLDLCSPLMNRLRPFLTTC